jgi:predicted nucleic acid-binding protein
MNVTLDAARGGALRHVQIVRRLHVRTSLEDQKAAFAYLKRHADTRYSAVDCLSFMVMLRLGIQEAWTFDGHFAHRFIARPCPVPALEDRSAAPIDSASRLPAPA